jgi:hypothetical protein
MVRLPDRFTNLTINELQPPRIVKSAEKFE